MALVAAAVAVVVAEVEVAEAVVAEVPRLLSLEVRVLSWALVAWVDSIYSVVPGIN
ncbi:MAG: hypothetical protein OEZ27_05950 [Nitrospinota bacterium]|nr:hypothetical protein [Nitrospinota bacterium]